MNNEKKFLIPEAAIISFSFEDIITESTEDWYGGNEDVGGVDGPDIPH